MQLPGTWFIELPFLPTYLLSNCDSSWLRFKLSHLLLCEELDKLRSKLGIDENLRLKVTIFELEIEMQKRCHRIELIAWQAIHHSNMATCALSHCQFNVQIVSFLDSFKLIPLCLELKWLQETQNSTESTFSAGSTTLELRPWSCIRNRRNSEKFEKLLIRSQLNFCIHIHHIICIIYVKYIKYIIYECM